MKRRFGATRSRGSAYLMVLGALLALTATGLALIRTGQTERRIASSEEGLADARDAAESGLATLTSLLIAGRAPMTDWVVSSRRPGARVMHESRFRAERPEELGARPCHACADDVDTVAKVDFRLRSSGVAVVYSRSAPMEERTLASASISATLTLQPWAMPGGEAPTGSLGCSIEAAARVRGLLEAELHPASCRRLPPEIDVAGLDPLTGERCVVRLSTCVLLEDWRLE